jgi:signal transduction histidine kinase
LTILTNMDSKTQNISHEEIDLFELLEGVRESLKISADKKSIKIIIKNSYPGLYIMGDEVNLEKLFLNLIKNAIKYNRRNGWIKIWIEKGEEMVKIHIADNGIGIGSSDLPFIFERFYRSAEARSHGERGSGLGLAICKWIIESHNGRIGVESQPGEASVFTVYLPYDYKKQSVENKLVDVTPKQGNLL